jgi:hypothetical protein
MTPIEPTTSDAAASHQKAVTISDVDAAFRQIGLFPGPASAANLEATLIAYTKAMKQRAMLPEHLIISVRVAALNAMPHLSDASVTEAIRLCLDHYFPG